MKIFYLVISTGALTCLFCFSSTSCAQNSRFNPTSLKEGDLLLPTTNYYYTWVEQEEGQPPDFYVAVSTLASPVALLQWHLRGTKSIIFFPDTFRTEDLVVAAVVCTNTYKTAMQVCKKAEKDYVAAKRDFKACNHPANPRVEMKCEKLGKEYARRFPWITDLLKIGFIKVLHK